MKNLLSLRYILLLLLSCTISFYACKKSNTDSTSIAEKSNINVARIQKLTIESLVDTMFSEITDKKDNSFFIQYRNLSPLELEKYNEIALSKNSKLMQEKGYIISEDRKQEILSSLKKFNDLALRTFKKSSNALTPSEFFFLKDCIHNNVSSLTSCTSYRFPIKGSEATSYNTDCSSIDRASTPDHPTDCDYQLKFTGFSYCPLTLYVYTKIYLLHYLFKYYWDDYHKVLSRQDPTNSNIYVIVGNGIDYLYPTDAALALKTYVAVQK